MVATKSPNWRARTAYTDGVHAKFTRPKVPRLEDGTRPATRDKGQVGTGRLNETCLKSAKPRLCFYICIVRDNRIHLKETLKSSRLAIKFIHYRCRYPLPFFSISTYHTSSLSDHHTSPNPHTVTYFPSNTFVRNRAAVPKSSSFPCSFSSL